MELTDFLHADTNSCNSKGDFMIKNGCGQYADGTLKLTISEEGTDRINCFLHVDSDSQKLKANQKFLGCAWSKLSLASLLVGL